MGLGWITARKAYSQQMKQSPREHCKHHCNYVHYNYVYAVSFQMHLVSIFLCLSDSQRETRASGNSEQWKQSPTICTLPWFILVCCCTRIIIRVVKAPCEHDSNHRDTAILSVWGTAKTCFRKMTCLLTWVCVDTLFNSLHKFIKRKKKTFFNQLNYRKLLHSNFHWMILHHKTDYPVWQMYQ